MNVIIVNDFAYVNGGTGKVAVDTAKLLAARGHSVIFFAAVGPVAEELQGIENMKVVCLNQHDILHDRNRLRAAIQGIWNFKAAKAMREILEKMSPKNTIIHIHSLQKAVSSSIIPVAKKAGFKIIYHVHDYGIACPNLGFFDYRKQEICKRRALSLECVVCNCDSRRYTHKLWRVLRQMVQIHIGGMPRNIDGFVFLNSFGKNILEKYLC